MADTYTQIYIQIVFAVHGRQNLIQASHQEELNRYITGIITNKDQKLLAIGGMPDHLHILVGLKPTIALSDLVRDVKANASKFINDQRWVLGRFEWQAGFGGFSYSRSQIDDVCQYILNQQQHHAKRSFKEEYLALLRKFDIHYDDKYLFSWIE
jgi:putative transposase